MVGSALDIRAISWLCSNSFSITGRESLGISTVEDPSSPYYGRIPIPPVLDAQIDQIWMAKMKKLKKKVLAELKMKILGRDRKDWYPTFLTTFTLVSNLETLYENQNRQLVRYCEKVCIVTCSSMNNG